MSDLISHLESWRVSQGGGQGMGEPALEIPIEQIGIVTMTDGAKRAFIRMDDLISAIRTAQS